MGLVTRVTVYCDRPKCESFIYVGFNKVHIGPILKANQWKIIPANGGIDYLCPKCYEKRLRDPEVAE